VKSALGAERMPKLVFLWDREEGRGHRKGDITESPIKKTQ